MRDSDFTTETVLSNARIVTPSEVIEGSLVLRDGEIAEITSDTSDSSGHIDCEGDYLIPGLVDLHTDNLEKHLQPRPKVLWDSVGAAMSHDGQMATAGVTTVFDSLSVHGTKNGFDRSANLEPMITGLQEAQAQHLLRVDHKLHLRCEISSIDLVDYLTPHLDNPLVGLMSTNDHSPGQRQMRNVTEEQMLKMLKSYGKTDDEIAELKRIFEEQKGASFIEENRAFVVQAAKDRNVPLASHDDETPDHIRQSLGEGSVIAEFPVTMEAAQLAHDQGMAIVMGAPNLLRGGSHSGNIATAQVAQAGLLDILASDYLPLSMLRAAFLLTQDPINWTLPRAVATVTKGPADATGLIDRGAIEAGKRADLVRVRQAENGWPQPRAVWSAGVRVA